MLNGGRSEQVPGCVPGVLARSAASGGQAEEESDSGGWTGAGGAVTGTSAELTGGHPVHPSVGTPDPPNAAA